jgi:hypothetical protein
MCESYPDLDHGWRVPGTAVHPHRPVNPQGGVNSVNAQRHKFPLSAFSIFTWEIAAGGCVRLAWLSHTAGNRAECSALSRDLDANPAPIAAWQTLIDSCGHRRQFGDGDQKMTKLTECVETTDAA